VSGVGYRRWSGYGGIERSGGIEEEGTDEEAARTLGLKLHVLRASTERAFEPAFAALKRTCVIEFMTSSRRCVGDLDPKKRDGRAQAASRE